MFPASVGFGRIGERTRLRRPLGQARGPARLLLGGVTARRLILPYKGIPGDAAIVILEFPLFLLFIFLVSI
jgi:hypothetical protein